MTKGCMQECGLNASVSGGSQEKMLYKVPCKFCGKDKVIKMTYSQYERLGKFNNGEGHMQDLLPDMPKEIREMFISGMCPECWEKYFGESEEEQDV